MPRAYTVKFVVRILESKGFLFVSQNGSHAKYRKSRGKILTVIVPVHGKDIKYGTLKSILRQSKLNESDFVKKKK